MHTVSGEATPATFSIELVLFKSVHQKERNCSHEPFYRRVNNQDVQESKQ